MEMVQRHWKILLFFCLGVAVFTGICFTIFINKQRVENDTVKKTIKKLEALASNKDNLGEIEKEIQQTDDATRATRSVQEMTTQDNIDALNVLFTGSVIVGDSITEGLTAYNILAKDKVVYKRGVSIKDTQSLLEVAAGLNPANIFLAFGMNDIETYQTNINSFIEVYKGKIDYIRQVLPNTTIFVNSIQPATDAVIAKRPDFSRVPQYNEALFRMCEELSITYIDNQYILKEHPEFYAKDGIHVSSTYYPIWLENMAEKAGMK
ncbi:MAG: GDSL-type esterase/lipase family protein [Lachnospiraceae bacterium]